MWTAFSDLLPKNRLWRGKDSDCLHQVANASITSLKSCWHYTPYDTVYDRWYKKRLGFESPAPLFSTFRTQSLGLSFFLCKMREIINLFPMGLLWINVISGDLRIRHKVKCLIPTGYYYTSLFFSAPCVEKTLNTFLGPDGYDQLFSKSFQGLRITFGGSQCRISEASNPLLEYWFWHLNMRVSL